MEKNRLTERTNPLIKSALDKCPKCNYQQMSADYFGYGCWFKARYIDKEDDLYEQEHVEYTCGSCGYIWRVRPCDYREEV